MLRTALFVLSWLVIIASGFGMVTAVLVVDTIHHPQVIQGIIAGLFLPMAAGCAGSIVFWPKGRFMYF